jgi:hypothetical protein
MQMEFDADSKIEELVDLWPKKREMSIKAVERKALAFFIKTEEDFQVVKNSIEIRVEDQGSNKFPELVAFVRPLFCKQPSVSTKEISNQTDDVHLAKDSLPASQADLSKHAERLFLTIWDVWPRNPEFIERRQFALDAFVSAAKVFPLASLETACRAYADSFNEGSNSAVYTKTLKNFVSDKELVEHWLAMSSNKSSNKESKAIFENAYAWYPDFTNKKATKVKDASWVMYWRHVKSGEQLDFNAACRCYRQRRRSAFRAECGEMSLETIATYTKSFGTFVTEWKTAVETGVYSKNELVDAKFDMVGDFSVRELKENGLDVVNIWGWTDGPFFSNMALKYMFSKDLAIKDALIAVLKQAPAVVEEKLKSTDYMLKIKDPELAKSQMEGYNAEELAAKVYQRLLEVKLTELPVEPIECTLKQD